MRIYQNIGLAVTILRRPWHGCLRRLVRCGWLDCYRSFYALTQGVCQNYMNFRDRACQFSWCDDLV